VPPVKKKKKATQSPKKINQSQALKKTRLESVFFFFFHWHYSPLCGFSPVEQDPSIVSYLSPTLSIIVKSIQLFPLFDFRNNKFFTVWGC
jgi:hypothetical protein